MAIFYHNRDDIFENVKKIDANFVDTYYSIAVAMENAAYDRINGIKEKEIDCTISQNITIDAQTEKIKKTELTQEDKLYISKMFFITSAGIYPLLSFTDK